MSLKIKDNLPAFVKAMDRLLKSNVLVGIPDANAGRNEGPITNASLGYIHEFGSPAQNIPERPFLLPGMESAEDAIAKRMEAGAKKCLSGDAGAAEDALHAVGVIAQNAVKAKINSNIPPALSPRTLRERRERGVTREDTLVDSGGLRDSITYVIRPNKQTRR